jgi:hypothetical protein
MPKHSVDERSFTVLIAYFASSVRIPLKRETGKPTRLSFANLQHLCVFMVE